MDWYYAENGQQRGPINPAELDKLVAAGTVQESTLVWREGMEDWQTYGQVSDGTAASERAGGIVCSQCGRRVDADQAARLGAGWICATCNPDYLREQQAEENGRGTFRYGGFWIRLLAKVIDGLIIGIPITVVYFLVLFPRVSAGGEPTAADLLMQLLVQLLAYALSGVYTIFFLGKYGATPGKMVCGLKVATAMGDRISYGRATGRFFGEMLSGLVCYIGYIIAAFDGEKRALHDHICATRVIRG